MDAFGHSVHQYLFHTHSMLCQTEYSCTNVANYVILGTYPPISFVYCQLWDDRKYILGSCSSDILTSYLKTTCVCF